MRGAIALQIAQGSRGFHVRSSLSAAKVPWPRKFHSRESSSGARRYMRRGVVTRKGAGSLARRIRGWYRGVRDCAKTSFVMHRARRSVGGTMVFSLALEPGTRELYFLASAQRRLWKTLFARGASRLSLRGLAVFVTALMCLAGGGSTAGAAIAFYLPVESRAREIGVLPLTLWRLWKVAFTHAARRLPLPGLTAFVALFCVACCAGSAYAQSPTTTVAQGASTTFST